MKLTRATSFARAKLYVNARKFQLFTNMGLTRATSFAWAKLYVNARKFQLFTNMGLTRATSFARQNSMSVQTIVVVNFKRTTIALRGLQEQNSIPAQNMERSLQVW